MARSAMVLAAAVLAMFVMGAVAQSPANCESLGAEALTPCLEYITSSAVTPPAACCTGLGGLNTNNPACLCEIITKLNGTDAASIPGLNITKAFTLPSACSISLKTSGCSALANIPAPPAGTPPTTTAPVTANGPTAASGPAAAGPAASHASTKFLPTSWMMMMGVAAAAAVGIQAFF